jgi:hypothetical protein
LYDLLATDGENLPGEIAASQRERSHLLHVVKRFGVGREFGQCEIAVAEHAREQIVEVVGNAAGEGADGFHLLRLAQLLFTARECTFGFAACGDVDADGEPAGASEPPRRRGDHIHLHLSSGGRPVQPRSGALFGLGEGASGRR